MSYTTPLNSIAGLASGLDTTSIITKLMQIEQQPQAALQRQQQTQKTAIAAYQSINSKMSTLGTAAAALNTTAGWNAWTATTSDSTAVTATATSTAIGGSLSFSVDKLATAGARVSTGTLSSLATVVATGPILVAKGGSAYGIGSVAGSGLTDGSHSVVVTQSSAGAKVTGSPVSASTTIDGTNNSLDVTIDGVASTLTIASGTYTQSQLASAVQTASNGALSVTVDNTGSLLVSTTNEGSAHSLQISGGSAATSGALGLSAGAAVTGTDGVLKADNGATVNVSDVRAGQVASLASDTGGSISVTMSGGLRAGTLAAKSVNIGDGSLQSVVNGINNANMGVSATAVQTGSAAYRLQLSSNTAGTANDMTIDGAAFTGIGSMTTLVQASDAQITVGSGPGAYQVTASSNTISTLLPGVTLTLQKADPNATQTVNVNPDGSGLADKIQKMVDAANSAVTEIQRQTSYDSTNKTAGTLLGDPTVGRLQDQVDSAVANAVGASSLTSAGLAGVSIDADGSISFDKSKFLTAYANDPASVSALFKQGATTTSNSIGFVSAGSGTVATGQPWAVNITAAATQAGADGTVQAGGVLANAETLSLRVGTNTVSYSTTAGQSLSSIADGLNKAMAGAGLGLTVTVDPSNKLLVRSAAYGAAVSFDMQSSGTGSGLVSAAGTWETHTGTDVAGTINGVAATGTGQLLSAPATDPVLGGVILRITGSSTGSLGSVTYTPGAAQRLVLLSNQMTDSIDGSLTLAIQGRQKTVSDLGNQITNMQTLLDMKQTALQNQFNSLESSLSSLQSQGNYLMSQIAKLG